MSKRTAIGSANVEAASEMRSDKQFGGDTI
jgi:hypothetical protein